MEKFLQLLSLLILLNELYNCQARIVFDVSAFGGLGFPATMMLLLFHVEAFVAFLLEQFVVVEFVPPEKASEFFCYCK